MEHGWFVQDFDLDEVRELRARERWPRKRPGSAMYDGQFRRASPWRSCSTCGSRSRPGQGGGSACTSSSSTPTVFERLGLPLHEPLVDLLRAHGLDLAALAGERDVLRQPGAQAAATR